MNLLHFIPKLLLVCQKHGKNKICSVVNITNTREYALPQLRVHNRLQSKYYYALSWREAKLLRVVGGLGIFALALMLIGFALFAQQHWLIAVVCVPFFTIIAAYHFVNYILLAFYPGFNTKLHRKKVAEHKARGVFPKVAVLIPAAGEDEAVVRRTAMAAKKIRYANFTVFILDDSPGGIYRVTAKDVGVQYCRRKEVGLHKKAGNLNAALKGLDGYSHALVLDADFVPRKEILQELVPYAEDDVSIVQSPQHFNLTDNVYSRSKFEFGAAFIQRDFYRVTQVARNRFGGAICVGTNALYNIGAVKQAGGYEGVGPKHWGHSEDVHTGLKTINLVNKKGQRYRIVYVPIQLATGTCPSTHYSFYKQQNRWATGSMQLLFSRKTLFSKALTLSQKLCYASNSLYYFYTIAMLFSPVQLLILVLVNREYQWAYTLLFIPMLVITFVIVPFVMRKKVEPIATTLVVISNAYTFAQALFLLFVRRPLGWEATGAAGKRSPHFSVFKLATVCFFISIYLITFMVVLLNQRIGLNPSIFIVTLFIMAFLAHIVYLHYMLTHELVFKKLHISRHFYAYFCLAALTIFAGVGSYRYGSEYDVWVSRDTLVSIETVKPPTAQVPPLPQPDSALDIMPKLPVVPEPLPPVSSVVAQGDTQFAIAKRLVADIILHYDVQDNAVAGKLHDKLVHAMGYQHIVIPGVEYYFEPVTIKELLQTAYVQSAEEQFWRQYAIKVGVNI